MKPKPNHYADYLRNVSRMKKDQARWAPIPIPDPTPAVRTFSIPPTPVDPAMFDRILKALLRAYAQIDDCPLGECPSCQDILETIHEAQRYKGTR